MPSGPRVAERPWASFTPVQPFSLWLAVTCKAALQSKWYWGEIDHRGDGQAEVNDPHTRREQPDDERPGEFLAVGPEIVADHDGVLFEDIPHHGTVGLAKHHEPVRVDLFADQPTDIVFRKPLSVINVFSK